MNRNRKIKTQSIISIIISIIVVIWVTIHIIALNYVDIEERYIAEKGVLDITDWNIENEGNIKLDGQWEFYPGVLLKSEEIKSNRYDEIKKYADVPGSWKDYLNEDESSHGAGTYRLVIKVPEDRIYGVKTRTIRSAARIYLNGQEVAHLGNPSENKEDFKRESKYKLGTGNSLNKEIELIVQVANYDYKVGGIVKSVEFGSFESIMRANSQRRAIETLMISVCLTLCIYFLIIYSERRKEYYLLYFSGMNLFMSIYLATMNEQILDLIYDYSYNTRTTIQVISMIIVTIFLSQFVRYFFNDDSSNKIVNKISIIVFLVLGILGYRPNVAIYTYLRHLHGILLTTLIIRYVYIFYILIREIYKKSDLLEYILVITISMFLYWFTMALKILIEIDLGNIHILLILICMFGIATLMNRRLQLDYERANELSERLMRHDMLKDEFLAKASHELRTPLHIILNLTKNLLEGKKGTLNSKQQENLFFIHQEGQRLTRLVEDLLDASQIKKEEIKLRLSPIKPYEIVEDILKEMKVLIPKDKSIILKNQIPSEFPLLKADPDKFRQIVYNLVHNAIKYTRDGEIVVSASIISGQGEIRVSDTGIGIKEKYLEEVFDIFYKENEEGQGEQGLGLGLSIVKHLVENQNGKICVESLHGKGSIFKFTLPIYDGQIEQQEDIIPIEENVIQSNIYLEKYPKLQRENIENIGKLMVLIVDDKPLNQKVLVNIMSQLGLNTILADNGKEALDVLEKNKIDLIVLDFMLPDISGDKVCKKIRQKYSMVELPILILTASGRTIDLMNAFDYGANDFQRKPIDSEELKSRIQSLLLMKKSVEEGLEKEFQYFYSQISPHFLYNTINTIIGLSYKDSEKARIALNNLSIYFRGKLDIHREKGLVTLESELELIMAYLEIEQMRYGERLNIEYDIEEGLKAMIPPLTLQPIVENSVRHGATTKASNGTVKITARRDMEGFIKITIEDNGIGMTAEKQEEILKGNNQRIGFKNVMEKIKIIKGAKLILKSNIEKGTIVEIIIPEVGLNESNFN